jgi:hypothetical protein
MAVYIGMLALATSCSSLTSTAWSTTPRLPSDHEDGYTGVVEVSEGRVGILCLIDYRNLLHYSIWQNESGNASAHPLDITIPLPCEYEYYYFATNSYLHNFLIVASIQVILVPTRS